MTMTQEAAGKAPGYGIKMAMGMMFGTTIFLSGCATFLPDQGMEPVFSLASSELNKDVIKIRDEDDARHVRDRVDGLLSGSLSADDAVQIALLNNRGLQAAFNSLAVSETQMVEAGLPPSPTFSIARLAVGGLAVEVEREVLQNVLALLTLPRRREIAADRFRQAQLRAIEAVLRLSAETRRTYYRAVAAGQNVIFLKSAQRAAQTLSDLAKKLGETGAMSKLSQAREHAFYIDVSRQLAVARLRHRSERDQLARLMGLWGEELGFRLPDELPKLPRSVKDKNNVEMDAVSSRVDLQMARIELEALAKSFGLTNATRFINVFELRGRFNTERARITEVDYELVGGDLVRTEQDFIETERPRGLELEFQIPIYDFGEARTRGQREAYLEAVNKLADLAVNVRGEARVAYIGYRGAYDIARVYRDKLLPLRDVISEEMLLQYNGMLSDLFELIQDSRVRIQSNLEATNAEAEFWQAGVDLQAAILGGGGGAAGPANGGGTEMAAAEGGGH